MEGVSKIGELVEDGVHYGRNFAALAAVLEEAGPEGLLVVTDFDQTLTRFRGGDGLPGLQCHDIMFRRADLSKRPGLKERMSPLLAWHDVSEEERMKLCNGDATERVAKSRWFFDEFAAVSSEFCLAEQVEDCVARSNTKPREGLAQTFEWLSTHGVPLVVVSAGLSQVITAILNKDGLRLPVDTKVVANDLLQPVALITSRNKKDALAFIPGFDSIATGRRQVLLLGDKPTDCDVMKGLPVCCTVLKIGFMEQDEPPAEDLDRQLEHFDAVLTRDSSMAFVNKLLHRISGRADAACAL